MTADPAAARVVLQRPGPQHFASWVRSHAGAAPPVSTWDLAPRPPESRSRDDFDALMTRIAQARERRCRGLFVVRRDDGALLGSTNLFDITRGSSHSAFVGYHIFNQFTGQGFATEAVAEAVTVAFDTLKLHRVEACVEPDNRGSIRVLKKVGFRHEGRARNRIWQRDAWRDVDVFAITVEDRGGVWSPPDSGGQARSR